MTKENLIEIIQGIKDQSILNDIQRLLKIRLSEEVFITSSEQQDRIYQAREDIAKRDVIDSSVADKDIDSWLNE
ncbi:MAG: hypothetical protein KDC76_01755 [Bacteroidetes bacterium]|nr:hypothetical protein [Bacteroidota bacterium]